MPAPAQMDATASLPESARAWIDPFGGTLRHADYARRVGSEADHLEPLESYAETYVAPGRPSVLASVFEPEDARELFGVLVGDARLGPSVRCAAADQLCVCAADERLESEMIRPAHLASVARLAAYAAVAEGPDLDVASASLKLLAAVVSRSRRARAFFSDAAPAVELDYNDLRDGGDSNRESPTTPYGRAAHLFPLAFHPRPSVRERFAVFAAYVGSAASRIWRRGGSAVWTRARPSPTTRSPRRRRSRCRRRSPRRSRCPSRTTRAEPVGRRSVDRDGGAGRGEASADAEGARDADAETRDAPTGRRRRRARRARARRARGPPRDEPRDAGRRFGSDEKRRFAFRRGCFCFRKRRGRILVRAHRRRATAMGLTGIVGDDVAGSARRRADTRRRARRDGDAARRPGAGAPGAAAIATAAWPEGVARGSSRARRARLATRGSGPRWLAC